MHDAIAAEKMGLPAAAVMTDRFRETARMMARMQSMPDYPFAVIAHPISNNSGEELRAKAAEAVRQSVALLTQRPVVVGPRAGTVA